MFRVSVVGNGNLNSTERKREGRKKGRKDLFRIGVVGHGSLNSTKGGEKKGRKEMDFFLLLSYDTHIVVLFVLFIAIIGGKTQSCTFSSRKVARSISTRSALSRLRFYVPVAKFANFRLSLPYCGPLRELTTQWVGTVGKHDTRWVHTVGRHSGKVRWVGTVGKHGG